MTGNQGDRGDKGSTGVGLDGPDGDQGLRGTSILSLAACVPWLFPKIPNLHDFVRGSVGVRTRLISKGTLPFS